MELSILRTTSRTSTELYENLPLQPDSQTIRILDIQPGEQGSPVTAKLRVVDLKNKPDYTALS